MRLRLLRTAAVVASAALAVAGLSACNTKVGLAAVVGGHRISDAEVQKYLTRQAVPFQVPSQGGAPVDIVPRSFVLQTLIEDRLFAAALVDTGGTPSSKDMATELAQVTQGQTPTQVAQGFTKYGFTASFAQVVVHRSALEQILATRVGATSDFTPLLAEVAKLNIPVSVNARYGSWDARSLGVQTGPSAGVPDFVTLHPSPASGSGSPTG